MNEIEELSHHGTARRAALDAQRAATRTVSTAVLAAKGAGAETPQITEIAAENYTKIGHQPITALTRQGVHKILGTRAEEIPAAWEAAGRPSNDEALDQLRDAVAGAIPVLAEYRRTRDALVSAMWAARDAGHKPRAVADASGFASQTAFDYLALHKDWKVVHGALAALLAEREEEEPHFPLLGLVHTGTRFWVQNVTQSAAVDRRVEAALAPAGWRIPPKLAERRFRGHWLPLEKSA